MIGGWSLVSSSLKYQTTLLRRLHLIEIQPHEFDKLLRHHLIQQLDTLLVDVTQSNLFNYREVEGVYLTNVQETNISSIYYGISSFFSEKNLLILVCMKFYFCIFMKGVFAHTSSKYLSTSMKFKNK
jgi:hypothetical protein